jgi:hypothetical protein
MGDLIKLMYEKYVYYANLMSKANYTPAIASGEVALLLFLYVGGMGLAVYNLPLEGPLLIVHLYGAILVTVTAFGLLAASFRYGSKGLMLISLLNVIFVLYAAFMGSFYFSGVTDPSYLLAMGMGFVGALFSATGCIIYAIRRG